LLQFNVCLYNLAKMSKQMVSEDEEEEEEEEEEENRVPAGASRRR
jgi:hypothetical protein